MPEVFPINFCPWPLTPGSLYGSRFLTGGLGGSVTHRCFYSPTPANKYERKFWCEMAATGVCYTIISSSSYTSSEYRGRVALGDTPQNGTFTVTMTGLRSSDEITDGFLGCEICVCGYFSVIIS
uniref:Uncharacterized protein n=1 Tax=Corvus moneduloides TaxID=1196302 RepID=A0A8C3EFT9_CORMO